MWPFKSYCPSWLRIASSHVGRRHIVTWFRWSRSWNVHCWCHQHIIVVRRWSGRCVITSISRRGSQRWFFVVVRPRQHGPVTLKCCVDPRHGSVWEILRSDTHEWIVTPQYILSSYCGAQVLLSVLHFWKKQLIMLIDGRFKLQHSFFTSLKCIFECPFLKKTID